MPKTAEKKMPRSDAPASKTDLCACPKCGYKGPCALMDELEEGRKYIAAFEQWKVDYFGATAMRERSDGKTILKFQLFMPVAASWNGKWTGEGRYYARTREVSKEKTEQLQDSYSYSWSDGWRARVEITQTDSGGAAEVEEKSVGFSGYDWMIDAILKFGEILDTKERERGP